MKEATIGYFEHELLSGIARYGRLSRNVLRDEEGEGYGDGDYEIRVRYKLYTSEHVYNIKAVERSGKLENSYLGCIMSNRKSRPGENHTRGADLADGKLCKDTWVRILGDIVSIEMKELDIQESCKTDLGFEWKGREYEGNWDYAIRSDEKFIEKTREEKIASLPVKEKPKPKEYNTDDEKQMLSVVEDE